ncbi:hypothetical protein BDW27_113124 [Nocardiopsis sp. L17-MgMaSL7]|nr:hypothetical protein BDW27_113124 [Nocardiopsis sp. L17-MgMaSL7]
MVTSVWWLLPLSRTRDGGQAYDAETERLTNETASGTGTEATRNVSDSPEPPASNQDT